jgi:hypothetical protein
MAPLTLLAPPSPHARLRRLRSRLTLTPSTPYLSPPRCIACRPAPIASAHGAAYSPGAALPTLSATSILVSSHPHPLTSLHPSLLHAGPLLSPPPMAPLTLLAPPSPHSRLRRFRSCLTLTPLTPFLSLPPILRVGPLLSPPPMAPLTLLAPPSPHSRLRRFRSRLTRTPERSRWTHLRCCSTTLRSRYCKGEPLSP